MNAALKVAREDDGLLAHAGDEIVTGIWNLAFVPDEQPGASEDLLLLALVDLLAHEDFTADDAMLQIDQVLHRRIRAGHCVASLSILPLPRASGALLRQLVEESRRLQPLGKAGVDELFRTSR